MNPVRAAMVRQPRDYRWSSYAANAEGKKDALLQPHQPHPQYLRRGKDETTRREAYRALFKAQMDEPMLIQIRQATNGNYALGPRAKRGQAGRPKQADGEKQ